MKKIKYLIIISLLISMFVVPISAFYGNHKREGLFLILKRDDPTFSVMEATKLHTTYGKNYVTIMNFTLKDGTIISTQKDSEGEYPYNFLQIETVDSKVLKLEKECMAHTYPFEYKEFQTGEYIQPGEYVVKRLTAGWYEVENSNGGLVWIQPNKDVNYKITDGKEEIGTYNYIPGSNATFIGTSQTLSVDNVNGIPIYLNYMLKEYNVGVRPGYAMNVQYITIHNSAMTETGQDAKLLAKVQYNRQTDDDVWTSWHYQVDNHAIYQSIPINETTWHAADGMMTGNSSTVSIEICENKDGNYQQAELNAAYLTAQLLYELNLPSDAIKMHKDWSNKNCPKNIIEKTKGSLGWDGFKSKVKEYYDQLVNENKLTYLDQIDEEFNQIASGLNYTLNGNMVSQIPVNTSLQSIKEELLALNESLNITFLNLNDEILEDGVVSTSMRVKLQLNEKECILLLSVKGDVNGDGEILPTDYVLIKNHILQDYKLLKGVYAKSADYNLDGEILPTDYVQIKNYIMKSGAK